MANITTQLSRLPADVRRAALEVSAGLAGVSLRVSRAFVEAVPDAATILSAAGIRDWGELGRQVAMSNATLGAEFFETGVADLARFPEAARPSVFAICSKQLLLSPATAIETFKKIPAVAAEIADEDILTRTLSLAASIAHRSAKHSTDLLEHAPAVAAAIDAKGEDRSPVADAIFQLGEAFRTRSGGMTAELWAALPDALRDLSPDESVRLARASEKMIELGASVTLHFVPAAADVLRHYPEAFDPWLTTIDAVGKKGNAVLIAFIKTSPRAFRSIVASAAGSGRPSAKLAAGLLGLIGRIAELDGESALAALRSSVTALQQVSLEQFEQWVEVGINDRGEGSAKARRSFFALETRESNALLRESRAGLPLDTVQPILRMYVEGLTGREVEIVPLSAMPDGSRIGDGRTIYLPSNAAEFDSDEMNFRLYKVLAAHGSGQIEFGTFARDTAQLRAAYRELDLIFSATAEQRDAFSLAGYIEDVQSGERADPTAAAPDRSRPKIPPGSDYRAVLQAFPEPRLARRVFGTLENARIDSRLRHEYRGLRKDLDLMRSVLRKTRPYIFDVPAEQVPYELLFQITMCGGATDDARQFYGQVVSEIEGVIGSHLSHPDASVADTLIATSRVYNLFQNLMPERSDEAEASNDYENEYDLNETASSEATNDKKAKPESRPRQTQDIRDLFNAWNSMDDDGEPDDISGGEAWSTSEVPEQPLEPGDEAFSYDEWDRELGDHRVGWSRVIEKRVRKGDRTFVELARSRYRGVISSIRHQFQLMRPEDLTRVDGEVDGEDYDLNAVIDFVIDRRADGRQSERLYTKRLRRRRDVAVSILLDQSSSTARTITRDPLQPYTYPGRRIIEIEKEGLVLMSEALEAVGDLYSISGFTSEGRRNVKYYIVKDFGEKYSEETERRIGGITFQNNTRLGAAIRHSARKLLAQGSRTKLLIILTDGRPYDHDYGDARYAREDVREALTEAKRSGITPFCITIDRESEAELRDLYGEVGYTIIDDVMSLPERMPGIYRRLTT